MKRINFQKSPKKKVLLSVLAVILVVGLVGGGVALFGDKRTTGVSANDFVRGSLNENDGTFVKSTKSIVTQDLFECKGLEVTTDFLSPSDYQVFWYNEDELYLGATDKMKSGTKLEGNIPGAAVYARVVVYPIETDENGRVIRDFEIGVFEVSKYAKAVDIKVAKSQKDLQQNLFKEVPHFSSDNITSKYNALVSMENVWVDGVSVYDAKNVLKTEEGIKDSTTANMLKLNASNVSVYKIDLSESTTKLTLYLYSADGTYVDRLVYNPGTVYYVDLQETVGVACFSVLVETYDENAVLSEYLYRKLL